MESKECEIFLQDVLEIGRRYVASGAEIKRVEDSLCRIFTAYGFEQCEVYAVTSLIVATIKSPDGEHYTQSVRVKSSGTDLGRIEELNAQIRQICDKTPCVEQLTKEINSYRRPKPKPIIKCLGYMLAAGGFAVFFGGSIADGLVSAITAIAIYFMDYNFKLRNINNILYTFAASLVSGLIAQLLFRAGLGNDLSKIIIGDIMLLIPGLLLVNSVKEMLSSDIVAGLYRFVEAVFTAVALAGGFAVSLIALGGVSV